VFPFLAMNDVVAALFSELVSFLAGNTLFYALQRHILARLRGVNLWKSATSLKISLSERDEVAIHGPKG